MHPRAPRTPDFTRGADFVRAEGHDDRAIADIDGQGRRLAAAVGDVGQATIRGLELEHFPGVETPQYGFDVAIPAAAPAPGHAVDRVQLRIESGTYDAAGNFVPDLGPGGEPVYDEHAERLIAAQDLLSTIRSRVVEQGDKLQEDYTYTRRHTRFPDGRHAVGIEDAQTVYRDAKSEFVAHRMLANPLINTRARQNQVMARIDVQAADQMSALQTLAAERKSSHRPRGVLNFLRTHKAARFGLGVALAGGAALATMGGSLVVAGILTAGRSAVGAIGGYEAGAAAADFVQGRLARRKHLGRPASGKIEEGDIYVPAPLRNQPAATRRTRILAIEARPSGDRHRDRAELARHLGQHVVDHHELLLQTPEVGGATAALRGHYLHGAPGQRRLVEIQNALYDSATADDQIEINKWQAKQARDRNKFGKIGAVACALLPGVRAFGLLGGSELFGVGFGHHGSGGVHHHAPKVAKAPVTHHKAPAPIKPKPSPTPKPTPATPTQSPGSGNTPSNPSNPSTPSSGNVAPNSGGINITINGNHDQVIFSSSPAEASAKAAKHGARAGRAALGAASGRGGWHPSSTTVLHVKSGGGIISTLEGGDPHYHMSQAQAESAYRAMAPHLHVGPDLYKRPEGDFGVLRPDSNLKITGAASRILQERIHSIQGTSVHNHAANATSHARGSRGAATRTSTPRTSGVPKMVTTNSTANGLPRGPIDINITGNNDTVYFGGSPRDTVSYTIQHGHTAASPANTLTAHPAFEKLSSKEIREIAAARNILTRMATVPLSSASDSFRKIIENAMQTASTHAGPTAAARHAAEQLTRELAAEHHEQIFELTPTKAKNLIKQLATATAR